MNYEIIDLNDEQIENLETKLDEYDRNHINYKIDGNISIGVLFDGKIIAGVNACMTAYKILYVSTVYVDEEYRDMGIGRKLMETVEEKALNLGVNMIRLDTFGWQGVEFYKKLGYEQVGSYMNETDGFSEYFFLKKI